MALEGAAIAACHARARTRQMTRNGTRSQRWMPRRWRWLRARTPKLSRADAFGMAFGPAAALELFGAFTGDRDLRDQRLFPRARANPFAILGVIGETAIGARAGGSAHRRSARACAFARSRGDLRAECSGIPSRAERPGTRLAIVLFEMKTFLESDEDLDGVALARTTAVNVRCPGRAHSHGDECVICDAERDGTVEVLITHVERDALCCVARGRPFDRWLAPRLIKLGLLERVQGRLTVTPAGLTLVDDHFAAVS